MTNPSIDIEGGIEAVAKRRYEAVRTRLPQHPGWLKAAPWDEWGDAGKLSWRNEARLDLEAAAPHLQVAAEKDGGTVASSSPPPPPSPQTRAGSKGSDEH